MSIEKKLIIVHKPLSEVSISHIENKYLDIHYAETSPSQTMDIYLPSKGEGPFPVILHVHGGAFKMCDKRDIQVEPFLDGLSRGYAVVSINYRMSGEEIFPAAVFDCKCAVRFIKANAAKYNLDKDKIAAVGGSAGGHLSVMLAATPHIADLEDLNLGWSDYSSEIHGCVDWYGPMDFLLMDKQLEENGLGPLDHNNIDSPESEYLGGQITKLDYSYVKQSNPITYITNQFPPILIQHGDKDHLVPYQQSQLLYDEIKRSVSNADVTFDILKGQDHADSGFITQKNMERVFSFLKRVLK